MPCPGMEKQAGRAFCPWCLAEPWARPEAEDGWFKVQGLLSTKERPGRVVHPAGSKAGRKLGLRMLKGFLGTQLMREYWVWAPEMVLAWMAEESWLKSPRPMQNMPCAMV